MVVDTHIGRQAVRLGLTTQTNTKNAKKIEPDLMARFPRDTWTKLAHLFSPRPGGVQGPASQVRQLPVKTKLPPTRRGIERSPRQPDTGVVPVPRVQQQSLQPLQPIPPRACDRRPPA